MWAWKLYFTVLEYTKLSQLLQPVLEDTKMPRKRETFESKACLSQPWFDRKFLRAKNKLIRKFNL